MAKDSIELSEVKTAARRLLAVQKARVQVTRAIRALEASLPSMDPDLVFDLAMNVHAPKHWTSMPIRAVERAVAVQLGARPAPSKHERSLVS